MDWKHEIDELPEELIRDLRSLGEIRAPEELWHRVVLATQGMTPAPEALWERVQANLPEHRRPARVARVLPFSRPFAAAACLFILLGGGLVSWGAAPVSHAGSLAARAAGPRDKVLEYYHSRVVRVTATAESLTPMGRDLVAKLGGPMG